MDIEQLETDLAAAEQAVVDIKATAEAMRQELQDQYEQRDITTVQVSQRCLGYRTLTRTLGGVGKSKDIAYGRTCSSDPFR